MGDGDRLVPARDVKCRYGVSDMTIWRWLHSDNLPFPAPEVINKRRYWRLSALEEWERHKQSNVTSGVTFKSVQK